MGWKTESAVAGGAAAAIVVGAAVGVIGLAKVTRHRHGTDWGVRASTARNGETGGP